MSIRMTHVITCTSAGQTRARGAPARAARPSPAAPPAPAMLFYSFFKTLVGKEVTVELKNDLAVRGVLHSVDQYLNVKLEDIKVKSGIRGGGGVMPCVARGARRARQAGSARAAQRGAARAGRPSATSQCRPLSAPPPCVTLRVARVGACTDACGCMLCAARLSARPLVGLSACRLAHLLASQVVDPSKHPHLLSVRSCFIRGSVVRYVFLPKDGVDTEVLHDATRREARAA